MLRLRSVRPPEPLEEFPKVLDGRIPEDLGLAVVQARALDDRDVFEVSPDDLPAIDITAPEPCPARGTKKAHVRPDSRRLSADTRKRHSAGADERSGNRLLGPGKLGTRLTSCSSARKRLRPCHWPDYRCYLSAHCGCGDARRPGGNHSHHITKSLMTVFTFRRSLRHALRYNARFFAMPAVVVWLVGFGVLAFPRSGSAAVIWDWSFAGTEAGTFTTNGTLADAAGSYNFTITNFTVTSSTITSLIGSGYTETLPVQGFLWDGTGATQFYRSSGSFTNGSNFLVSSPAYTYMFFASSGTATGGLEDPNETPVVGSAALTLTAVPEPATYAMVLAGIACGGFSMWRRRKRA